MPNKQHDNYGIVVDSGSSGSRLQIYKWEDPSYSQKNSNSKDTLSSIPKIIQEESWSHKIAPGLSKFENNPGGVWDDHFKPLIEYAERIIPDDQISKTPIFIQATAGMRLIPEEKRNKILKKVCKSIKKHSGFLVDDCDKHIEVIDGETEGLYGWIGLNYLKGKLNNYDPTLPITEHDSYGFMDMGGASTQISFVPSNELELEQHKDDLYKVKLRSVNGETQDWSVFVSTWLGFGANEARKRHLRNLILSLPDGVSYDTNNDNIYDLVDPCSPKGMKIEQEMNGIDYEITGSGDYKMCLRYIYPLLLKHLPCKDDPCLFNGVHAPTIDFKKDKFVGVSEYWYTANDVFHMGGEYNFLKFEERLKEFCELSWDEIASNYDSGLYGDNIKEPLLMDSCFKASWVVNVLHEGFELPRLGFETADLSDSDIENLNNEDTEHIPFQSANLIDGAELSWTLGKIILYASSQVPSSDKSPVGVIPSESKKFITSSSAMTQSPHNVLQVQDKAGESLGESGSHFLYFLFSLSLLGSIVYTLYVKKLSPKNAISMARSISTTNLSSSSSQYSHSPIHTLSLTVQQAYHRLKNAALALYYNRLASNESAVIFQENQTNDYLECGNSSKHISKPDRSSYNNLTTLRTRSTVNLQDPLEPPPSLFQSKSPSLFQSKSPSLFHSKSTSAIFSNSINNNNSNSNHNSNNMNSGLGISGSVNGSTGNGLSQTSLSPVNLNYDFMSKKYSKYGNSSMNNSSTNINGGNNMGSGNNSPINHGLGLVGLGPASQLDLKSLTKGKSSD